MRSEAEDRHLRAAHPYLIGNALGDTLSSDRMWSSAPSPTPPLLDVSPVEGQERDLRLMVQRTSCRSRSVSNGYTYLSLLNASVVLPLGRSEYGLTCPVSRPAVGEICFCFSIFRFENLREPFSEQEQSESRNLDPGWATVDVGCALFNAPTSSRKLAVVVKKELKSPLNISTTPDDKVTKK